jgi:hypothetical protein
VAIELKTDDRERKETALTTDERIFLGRTSSRRNECMANVETQEKQR